MEPEIGDAFGMMLQAYLEAETDSEQVSQIIERDDAEIGIADPGVYFAPPDGDTADWVLQRLRGRLLDIGAGAGRYALAAQQIGCDVVALDVSEGALKVCRARGVKQIYLGTVTDLAPTAPEPFDTLLLMGANLGLLGSPDNAVSFLAALDTLAANDGRIIGQARDASRTDDPEHLRYHSWNRDRGLHPHLVRIRVRFERYATDWFDYLMPSPDELEEVLRTSAWTIDELQRMSEPTSASYLVALRKR